MHQLTTNFQGKWIDLDAIHKGLYLRFNYQLLTSCFYYKARKEQPAPQDTNKKSPMYQGNSQPRSYWAIHDCGQVLHVYSSEGFKQF